MSIYQKQIESEKLNNDVEAWLAQNIITELPMGFTNFKDGNIPLDRTRKTVISEKESIAKIEATNKAVREGKQLSASKQKRVLEVQQRKQEKEVLKQEQRRIVAEFFSKAKTGDITALGKMVGMPAETLRKVRDGVYLLKPERREKLYSVISAFKYGEIQAAKNQFKLVEFKSTDESSRKMLITTLAKWAQEKGETRFQGKCKNHGWAEYETKYGKTYCLACRTKHKEVSEAYKQNMLNSAERVKAIQAGEKTYFAVCPNHGRTEYQVLSNKRGICIECRRNRQGTARRLSEYLGISPTTMSHYTNGRAVLPDHHYEKFLEFKVRLQGVAA